MSSIVLGLDTATPDVAVAVCSGAECLGEKQIAPLPGERPRHAAAVLPAVEELVGAAGGWDAVARIAVGVGPGSFTGLRIGIATARTLAQAHNLELSGVSSLAALAAGIDELDQRDAGAQLAIIDARRSEVFVLLRSVEGETVWGPLVAPPDRVASLISDGDVPVWAAGDGALRFRAELEAGGIEIAPAAEPVHRLSARHVCLLSANPDEADSVVKPIYLRQPDAKLWRERDRGNP